jgi:hypothetical protein
LGEAARCFRQLIQAHTSARYTQTKGRPDIQQSSETRFERAKQRSQKQDLERRHSERGIRKLGSVRKGLKRRTQVCRDSEDLKASSVRNSKAEKNKGRNANDGTQKCTSETGIQKNSNETLHGNL